VREPSDPTLRSAEQDEVASRSIQIVDARAQPIA
jgi:hypothetical protein